MSFPLEKRYFRLEKVSFCYRKKILFKKWPFALEKWPFPLEKITFSFRKNSLFIVASEKSLKKYKMYIPRVKSYKFVYVTQ